MKKPDPRLKRIETLLAKAIALIDEVRTSPPPRRRRKRQRQRQRRFDLRGILSALRDGADPNAKRPSRDPRLPCRLTLNRYRRDDSQFGAEVGELLRARRRQSNRGRTAIRRPRKNARSYNWDEIATRIEAGAKIGQHSSNRQGLPDHSIILRQRRIDPAFAARIDPILTARRMHHADFDAAAVLDLIRQGAEVKNSPPQPGMPTYSTIKTRRKRDNAFASAYEIALTERRRRAANRGKLSRLSRDAGWVAAQSAVPMTMDRDLRDEVVAEISLMICSGEVGIDGDLKTAWKACRTKLSRPRWKESSLDAPIAGTDGLKRVDLLRSDAEHF